MNTITHWMGLTAVLLATLGTGCATHSDQDSDLGRLFPQRPNLPLPTTCPAGHTDLRDTPVLYGLLYMTPELHRQIENQEVITGGCVVRPGKSPPNLLICRQCQFRYDPYAGQWERSSHDPHSFHQPLSALLINLPWPSATLAADLEYVQRMELDHSSSEGVNASTHETLTQADQRINQYLLEHGMTVSSRTAISTYIFERGTIDGRQIVLTLSRYDDSNKTRLSILLK